MRQMNAQTHSDAILTNRRVLVVDDNKDLHDDFYRVLVGTQPLNTTRQALSKAEEALFGAPKITPKHDDFELECALQGEGGADMVRRALEQDRPYGCIFVDMRMPPGWDGVRTIQEIWAIDSDAQVVVCSAYSDHSWEELTDALDRSDQLLVLKKPFDAIEVRQMAASMCSKRTLIAKNSAQITQLVQAERLSAMGRIAAGVTHDFNNLLTAIMSFSSFVQKDMEEDDPRHNDLDHVIQAAQDASHLVKQLLLFSKPQDRNTQHVDINRLLHRNHKLIQSLLGDAVQFVLRPAPEPLFINAEAVQIERMLMNLVINANDAMQGEGRLTITTEHVDELLKLTIQDTGAGMSPEIQAQIFEPFFTTKPSGTGLGLASCYGIVQHHKGTIEVASTISLGTTFTVTFPLDKNLSKPTAYNFDSKGIPINVQHRTALVVDDQPIIRTLCKRILQPHNFHVTEAANGYEALYALKHHATDILITDMVMPEMSGYQLGEQALNEHPDLRVLYISGYKKEMFFEEDELDNLRVSFLSKPFVPGKLIEVVTNLLDHDS